VLAAIGAVIARPHLLRDLQRFLEQFEAHAERRKGHTQAFRFLLVPGGADAEIGTAAGQHIQRGRGLDENAGIAVDHARHHGAELSLA
jgi:hypothetical protein